MSELFGLQRQPTKLDYASPTQFRLVISQLPKVEYFVSACNLPGINLGEAIFPTPLKAIPVMGDTLTFENLNITFMVDEFLENYKELHDWLLAIGFPKSRTQFSNFRSSTSNTPTATRGISQDIAIDNRPPTPANSFFSDATLTILSNKNNPIVEVRFEDFYPVLIGGLQFTQDATDVQYLTTTADFSYKYYEIKTLT